MGTEPSLRAVPPLKDSVETKGGGDYFWRGIVFFGPYRCPRSRLPDGQVDGDEGRDPVPEGDRRDSAAETQSSSLSLGPTLVGLRTRLPDSTMCLVSFTAFSRKVLRDPLYVQDPRHEWMYDPQTAWVGGRNF